MCLLILKSKGSMAQKEMLIPAFPPTHNSSLPTDNNRRRTLESNPQLFKINIAHELPMVDKPVDRKPQTLVLRQLTD